MKRPGWSSLVCALLLIAGRSTADAAAMQRLYMLPMAGGLDQYLADWITREKIAQIVTDPKTADLVMTDRLGEGFEQKLAQLRPQDLPKPTVVEKKDDADTKASKPVVTAGAGTEAGGRSFKSTVARGTFFLVDVRSHQVVWSDHEKPRAGSDANLNREAERVAKKLQLTFQK